MGQSVGKSDVSYFCSNDELRDTPGCGPSEKKKGITSCTEQPKSTKQKWYLPVQYGEGCDEVGKSGFRNLGTCCLAFTMIVLLLFIMSLIAQYTRHQCVQYETTEDIDGDQVPTGPCAPPTYVLIAALVLLLILGFLFKYKNNAKLQEIYGLMCLCRCCPCVCCCQ